MLEFKGVSRWFQDVMAVNDVDIEIGSGITALLGPNGAGKSTVMKLAMGLLRPNQGTVQILGQNPWNNPQLLAKVGYVPEGPAPWRNLSGAECVEKSARLAGLAPADAKSKSAEALNRVGLGEAASKTVGNYSHGMTQRLKMAIALVAEPELLILDEPLLGTDPSARMELLRLIHEEAEKGTSILLSTHVLSDVEALTSRIVLLHHGRLMASGDIHEIRDLLDSHPRTIRITCQDPEQLGLQLWQWPTVRSLEREGQAVVVRTDQAGEFYAKLQTELLTDNMGVTAVTSPDDNLEAVFQYLVGSEVQA